MFFKKLTFFFILASICINLFSQESFKDTLSLSIQQADSIFIVQNLSLLAEKCNVNASKAQIIQARLFNNPTLIVNQNIINTEYAKNGGRKWFDITDKGETSVQIQQLFSLAGKRNKQIKLAELSANREEQIYFDLLRALKYSLRSGFYNIYYLEQIVKVYDKEITSLNKLIAVFQSQYEKGYISKKELLRLKSTLFSLENEKLGVSSQLISGLTDFNILMHTTNIYYKPQPDINKLTIVSLENLKLESLIDTAYEHRFDLKAAHSDLSISQMNYAYQKALAVPGVALSAGWDRNGSYVHNYNFFGLQFDLPFFNRNQGNIKSAKFNIESSNYKLQSATDQVKSDVISTYTNAIENNQLYNKFDKGFITDLDELMVEMLKNYEKKNISLIEFLDYYDAYKGNVIQLNKLHFNRVDAFEKLNFSVGTEVVFYN